LATAALALLAAAAGVAGPRPIPVTVAVAEVEVIERWEPSVGELEALTMPTVAAEVSGRVVAVEAEVGDQVEAGEVLARIDEEDYRLSAAAAEAEVQRLEALVRARRLRVERLRSLVRGKSASQSDLDDAQAELDALRAQLTAARVKRQKAARDLRRTRVASPVSGRVDERMVSVGDYVKLGAPLFVVTRVDRLRARLPYPESLGAVLRRGLPVRLESPMAPGRVVDARVSELRPRILPGNRAIEVLVDVPNPGGWEPGASVTGRVRVLRRENAVVVPEHAVIRRPAGEVVYALEDGVARQRVVRVGLRLPGRVEIRSGLRPGTRIAADGAGFLTDGAPVEIRDGDGRHDPS
jgi:RND family efflux transporter MFP subunit